MRKKSSRFMVEENIRLETIDDCRNPAKAVAASLN